MDVRRPQSIVSLISQSERDVWLRSDWEKACNTFPVRALTVEIRPAFFSWSVVQVKHQLEY